MMKISACWIVKNEAENIKMSIDSVKDCVEEMIVVDTGSTDDTVEIAKSCGAQIHEFEWINDFAAAKNYALSLVKGKYVIFPDADEYFVPPLAKEDGDYFEQLFEDTGADLLILNRMEIDKDSNAYMAVTPCERILRRETIHYENKAHDVPKLAGGKLPRSAVYPYTRLLHTGYSYALLEEKGRRNIRNLQEEQKQTKDPLKFYINTCYLLRENVGIGDYEAARRYTHSLLASHQYMKDACETYDSGFIFIFYCAILIAGMYPAEFRKEEVRAKLFGGIKENYAGTRDAELADLYYQLKFDLDEKRFLPALSETEPLLSKAAPAVGEDTLEIETEIFKKGAQIAFKQGDKKQASHFAKHAMQYLQQPDEALEKLLENCAVRISACWIAKNEAENIKHSIESVKDCAEELIVVDTGSSDDTVRIAEACGAKVYHFKWEDDFSAAKNYALSFANGDYVIFLDADEYFLPPVVKEDGDYFSSRFEDTDIDVLIISRVEVEKDTNTFLAVTPVERILRRATVHFENKIHENPFRLDGEIARTDMIQAARLMHTGYSNSNYIQKAKRNIKILEAEHERLKDPLKLYLNASYLMRESLVLEEEDKACKYLRYLLQNHQYIKGACGVHYTGVLQHLHRAVRLAERNMSKFNRKEIYDKLFGGIKENYPATRDAAIADLYYQLKFHYREDRFLRELEKVEPLLEEMPPPSCIEADQAESEIFQRGAEAAFLRRDIEKTQLYAVHAVEHMQQLDITPQRLLVYCEKEWSSESAAACLADLAEMGRLVDLPETFRPSCYGVIGAQNPEAAGCLIKAGEMDAQMDYKGIVQYPGMDKAAALDVTCAFYLARAELVAGQYDRAYRIIMPYLKKGTADVNLLEFLLIIAEKAENGLGLEARKYYEEFIALADGPDGGDLA